MTRMTGGSLRSRLRRWSRSALSRMLVGTGTPGGSRPSRRARRAVRETVHADDGGAAGVCAVSAPEVKNVAGNSAGWGASAATTIGTKGTSDPETGPEGIGGRAGVNMVDLCAESSSRNKCRDQRAGGQLICCWTTALSFARRQMSGRKNELSFALNSVERQGG
jgi:hypothetical protein